MLKKLIQKSAPTGVSAPKNANSNCRYTILNETENAFGKARISGSLSMERNWRFYQIQTTDTAPTYRYTNPSPPKGEPSPFFCVWNCVASALQHNPFRLSICIQKNSSLYMSCVLSAGNASPGCCKNSRARFFAPDPISYGRANCKMDEVSFREKAAFRILSTGKPYLLYFSVIRRARIRDAPGSSCSYKSFTRGLDHLKRRSSRPRFPRLLGCAVRNQKSSDYPCRVRHRRRGAGESQDPLHKIITYSPPFPPKWGGGWGKSLIRTRRSGCAPLQATPKLRKSKCCYSESQHRSP